MRMRPAHLTYQEILEKAKPRILHQDEAVARLSVILHYHLRAYTDCAYELSVQEIDNLFANGDTMPHQITPTFDPMGVAPIFLLGKTGAGKTHLVRELCKVAGVNFVAVNATHLSNAGYKGFTLADVGEMILESAGNDIAKALFSVVFFDEFDKLFMPMNDYQASFQRSLATEFLTILEGTSHFPVKDKKGISSAYMLFILGGSFGLHQDENAPIGFLAQKGVDSHLPKTPADFVKMGLFAELAGRIGQTIHLKPLDNQMLADILKHSPSSPFVKLQRQLKTVLVDIEMTDDFVAMLIDDNQALIEQFGVRGLYQAFNALPDIHQALVFGATQTGTMTLTHCGLACITPDDDAERALMQYDVPF